jgi:hypothetical protein
MNNIPLRSPKGTYLAAFALGALIALVIAAPARSAEPFAWLAFDALGGAATADSRSNKVPSAASHQRFAGCP